MSFFNLVTSITDYQGLRTLLHSIQAVCCSRCGSIPQWSITLRPLLWRLDLACKSIAVTLRQRVVLIGSNSHAVKFRTFAGLVQQVKLLNGNQPTRVQSPYPAPTYKFLIFTRADRQDVLLLCLSRRMSQLVTTSISVQF